MFLKAPCLLLAMALGLGVSANAYRLIGRVQHSEILPQVTREQEIGKIFQGTQLYKQMMARTHKPQKKFLLPGWLAGEWERTESTETSRMQLPAMKRLKPTGRQTAKVRDKFGTYRDAQGMIWQVFSPAHAYGSVDRGNAIDYHAVEDYQLVPLGKNSVVVEVQACHAVVSKKTNKVISAYQDEELNTYTMLAPQMLKTDSSVKVFDTHGKPMFLTLAVSTETKVSPFEDSAATDVRKKH